MVGDRVERNKMYFFLSLCSRLLLVHYIILLPGIRNHTGYLWGQGEVIFTASYCVFTFL